MKKIKYALLSLICMLFVPKVYALSYEIVTLDDVSVIKGSKVEIAVAIDNIKDTNDGVSACMMNILFGKNIELESSPRTLGSWTMTTGNMYLFDTGNPALNKSDIVKIPVVVNGDGIVELSNIVCSDGVEEISVSNKKINFKVVVEETNNKDNNAMNNDRPDNNSSNDNESNADKDVDDKELETSNCNLSNIELSEGNIDFDPNVTEYEVKITNFNKFQVTPILDDKNASYVIDRLITDDGGNIVITVNGTNGDFKIYTIYTIVETNGVVADTPNNNNYIPIFIGIIILLVLINIIRIVKNAKKK